MISAYCIASNPSPARRLSQTRLSRHRCLPESLVIDVFQLLTYFLRVCEDLDAHTSLTRDAANAAIIPVSLGFETRK